MMTRHRHRQPAAADDYITIATRDHRSTTTAPDNCYMSTPALRLLTANSRLPTARLHLCAQPAMRYSAASLAIGPIEPCVSVDALSCIPTTHTFPPPKKCEFNLPVFSTRCERDRDPTELLGWTPDPSPRLKVTGIGRAYKSIFIQVRIVKCNVRNTYIVTTSLKQRR